MSEKKKKVLFQSDLCLANTGFGRSAKCILPYLYNTDKYEIYHYCCGITQDNPALQRTPWTSIGTLPADPKKLKQIEKDPNSARMASYGALRIDSVIKDVKPDVYIAVQDIWGIDFAISRPWFKNISSVLWTTLDSLPILPTAVNAAKKVDNFWVWSKFAEEDLHKQGFTNVKTIHGAIDTSIFFKLPEEKRMLLKSKFKISYNDFVIGFVFRNQLRKSVPNLLEGFSMWKKNNPKAQNAKLLLHTNFSEGWTIERIAKEYGINQNDILTTYICQNCREYEVKPFTGDGLNCKYCGSKNAASTTNVSVGVSEEQLNEIYNLMDVYCHPFTSGGQEIPIQEAKLVELITLVTNYSCGEEMCCPEAHSLPLEWTEYREHGTEFRKASTVPQSIADSLETVFNMPPEEKEKLGKNARQWVVENFSKEKIGKTIEDFIDNCPFTDYDFEFENIKKDPNAKILNIENDSKWVTHLYEMILKRDQILESDDGHKYWMQELRKGMSRQQIENYFREVAIKENTEAKSQIKLSDLLGEDQNKRILYISPESKKEAFMCTSFFESIKEKFPEHNIYVASQQANTSIYLGNPNVFKVIPHSKEMENFDWLNGIIEQEDFFNIIYTPQNIKENRTSVLIKEE